MAAHQAPLSLGFSRQEHWSGLPFPSPMHESESEATQSCPTLSDPMDCSIPGSSHGIYQARVLEWVVIAFSILSCISSVQLLSCVRFFATPLTIACQAFLSITNSRSSLKLMSIKLVMPSHPLSSPSPSAPKSLPASESFPMSQLFT